MNLKTTFTHRRPRSGRGVALVAAIASSALLSVTPVSAETLEDALRSAWESNPTLGAERAGLRAANESIWQARAAWQPSVTVNGSYGHSETDNRNPGSTTTTDLDPISGSVVVNQPIFTGGQTYYGSKKAKAEVRAARANLSAVEQQVLLDAVAAYVDVNRDEAVVLLSKNNVQVLERQLQASQDRFRVGEITRTDVAQSEARLSGSRTQLINSEAALTASRSAYQRVIGRQPADLAEVPDLPPLPATEDEALLIALDNNPSLIAVREIESASKSAVRQARGAILPQVSVQGSLNHGEDTFLTGARTDTTTVTGNVTIPLYQGGAALSRIRQARQFNNQDRIQIAETERLVYEAVANAWEALRSTRATIISSQQQVQANEIAFEGVEQEAQVGSRTTLDVLDAEQELLDSRVALVRAKRNEYVAAYQLLATIGRLTGRDLGLAS